MKKTPFNPVSPYAISKLKAHLIMQRYRKEGFFTSCGILFNHESPRRGLEFITRKLTEGISRFKLGIPQRVTGKEYIEIGNLESKRDWGFAKEYVEAMWKMLQQNPDDYVIATGKHHTIRELVNVASSHLGLSVQWKGKGIDEVGYVGDKPMIKVNPKFFRPREVSALLGDSSKAKRELGWEPKTSFEELIKMMVDEDYKILKKKFNL